MAETNKANIGDKALKAGVWYTLSNVATKAILVLTTPIFTRVMTMEDYGVTATFTSWYTLLLTFCTLNLNYSVGRAKIDYKDKLNEYVGSMQLTSLLFSLIIALFAVVFVKPLHKFLELTPALVIILAVYLVFAPIISLQQAKFKYLYKYKGNILITLYTTITSVVLSLALVFSMSEDKFYGRILGIVIPTVLLSLVFWGSSIKKKYVSLNFEHIKYGLAISLPLLLNSVSLSILAQSDRVVITKFHGNEYTAIYTIAYQFAILISLVFDSIGQAWLPWFHDTYAEGDFASIKKNLKPLIAFGCYVGVGCIAVAPEAVFILGGSEYMSGQWVVAPIVLGLVCKFIYANYEHIELHLKKTQYIGMGTMIAAALNIALNIIFVPKYGFIAAGYTTFFSYLVLMSIHYLITKFVLKVDIYDHLFMYGAIVVVIVFAAVLQMLSGYIFVRYAIVIVLTVFMYFANRKTINKFLKKTK